MSVEAHGARLLGKVEVQGLDEVRLSFVLLV